MLVLVKLDTTSILSDVISDAALDAGHIVLSSEATQDDSCGLLIVPAPEFPATRLLNVILAVSQDMATDAQLVGRRARPLGCPATEQSTAGGKKLG
jgi:hypothetical protein